MEYIYAALLLHKTGKEITEEGIRKIVQAAGISADDAKIKTVVASLKGVDIEKALSEAIAMPAVTPSGGAAKAEAKEEKHEEKHEEAAEGLAALFG